MVSTASSYDRLIQATRETTILDSCANLLAWDERTYMPSGGAQHRADQHALIAGMVHERATQPPIGEWLADVEGSDLFQDPTATEAVNVREIRRSYDRMVKLPRSLVEALARVTTMAEQAWETARAESCFSLFQPHLEEVLRLKREEAAAIGFRETAYDALLDDYEPGETAATITPVLTELRTGLVALLDAISGTGHQPDDAVLHGHFDIGTQEAFGREAASAVGFDFDRGRLDVTTHPFCNGIGPGDTRITTRYRPDDFCEAFFGILHEAGHGIYDQGLDTAHYGTPMGEAASLGIHESQSRMFENLVGRSRSFWEHFLPKARQTFPDALSGVSLDGFYAAINRVEPSLIRVEADEVTYNLHILLRFELEAALVSGDMEAGDVPDAWNAAFERYLGFRPPDDAAGCLQDVHWGAGLFGYFPTYTLGNLYAAQLFAQAEEDLGGLDILFRSGDFVPLTEWLRKGIHSQGSRYRAGDLVKEITGESLSPRYLLDHLKSKFEPLYGI